MAIGGGMILFGLNSGVIWLAGIGLIAIACGQMTK